MLNPLDFHWILTYLTSVVQRFLAVYLGERKNIVVVRMAAWLLASVALYK